MGEALVPIWIKSRLLQKESKVVKSFIKAFQVKKDMIKMKNSKRAKKIQHKLLFFCIKEKMDSNF